MQDLRGRGGEARGRTSHRRRAARYTPPTRRTGPPRNTRVPPPVRLGFCRSSRLPPHSHQGSGWDLSGHQEKNDMQANMKRDMFKKSFWGRFLRRSASRFAHGRISPASPRGSLTCEVGESPVGAEIAARAVVPTAAVLTPRCARFAV